MYRNKCGKFIYSSSYGGGIYSWGYKEVACYMPLIKWLEKYSDENIEKDNKLIEEILKNLNIIEVKKEEIEYNNKVFVNEYIVRDGKKWIKKINNITVDNIKENKSREIIKILQEMYKNKLLNEYIIEALIQKLEIEEIYPNEEMYIHSYDGNETIEYDNCFNATQINYNEVISLNERSLNE